ncbi:MAG: hypothetical protein HY036_01775 [Nitrospirae bacterium]|nr:hypothetical protein [Nitrospirota bacterium]MBI3351285.1 hypothetical protein [Nitrospirota bacterium]
MKKLVLAFLGLAFLSSCSTIDNAISSGHSFSLFHDPLEDYEKVGINRNEADEWKAVHFTPEEARKWLDEAKMVGGIQIAPRDAQGWRNAKFTPKEATEWMKEFIMSPEEAAKWRAVGFTAPQASKWNETQQFNPADAKLWNDKGFKPEEAVQWQHDGFTAEKAFLWKSAKFNLKNATSWTDAKFEIQEAVQWKNAGANVTQAVEFKKKGISPERAKTILAEVNRKNLAEQKKQQEALRKVCPYGVEEVAKLLYYSGNPYDSKGRCYRLLGQQQQLLNRTTAIFSLNGDPQSFYYVDFGSGSAPRFLNGMLAKGQGAFEYSTVLGAKKVIPSLKVVE